MNTSKTKIVIFSRGRSNKNNSYTFQNKQIEVVDENKYLENYFGRSCTHVSAKNISQNRRAKLFLPS